MEDLKEYLLELELRVTQLEDKVKENEACNSYLQGFTKGLSEKVYVLERSDKSGVFDKYSDNSDNSQDIQLLSI